MHERARSSPGPAPHRVSLDRLGRSCWRQAAGCWMGQWHRTAHRADPGRGRSPGAGPGRLPSGRPGRPAGARRQAPARRTSGRHRWRTLVRRRVRLLAVADDSRRTGGGRGEAGPCGLGPAAWSRWPPCRWTWRTSSFMGQPVR
ncbi:hypothetical protein LT493_02560 [Streptomyces tricolor]|nr:hypothetical protein [Streptomyces tricolor]